MKVPHVLVLLKVNFCAQQCIKGSEKICSKKELVVR